MKFTIHLLQVRPHRRSQEEFLCNGQNVYLYQARLQMQDNECLTELPDTGALPDGMRYH